MIDVVIMSKYFGNRAAEDLYVANFKNVPEIRGVGETSVKAIEDLWSRGQVCSIELPSHDGNFKIFGGQTVFRLNNEFGIGMTTQAALASHAGCLNDSIKFFVESNGFAARIGDCRGTGKTPHEAMEALMEQRCESDDESLIDWVIGYLDAEYAQERTAAIRIKIEQLQCLKKRYQIACGHCRQTGKKLF